MNLSLQIEASISPPRDQNPPVLLNFLNWKFEQKLYYLLTTNVAFLNILGEPSLQKEESLYNPFQTRHVVLHDDLSHLLLAAR